MIDKKLRRRAYNTWYLMHRKTYDETHRHYKAGYKVCPEWHTFDNFLVWFVDNFKKDCVMSVSSLSKDKIYSPENCCYVPRYIDNFFLKFSDKGYRDRSKYYEAKACYFHNEWLAVKSQTEVDARNDYLAIKELSLLNALSFFEQIGGSEELRNRISDNFYQNYFKLITKKA